MSGKTIGVLFVCAGNICRSPLAEGIFLDRIQKSKVAEQFRVDSAGTGAWHAGERPDHRSLAVAREHGIEIPGTARQVQVSDFTTFDYLLCMDLANQADLWRIAPSEQRHKVHLIREFDPSAPHQAEVPDPYYGNESGFETVFQMLDRACLGFYQKLTFNSK
jgi:protein-tyrosine phosphatase